MGVLKSLRCLHLFGILANCCTSREIGVTRENTLALEVNVIKDP
jgi:hypothetical protein